MCISYLFFFFFQAEDGIRDFCLSRGLGDVYKRQAWTIAVGSTAPQAAGVIHTDFEKGFIRAEVISYDDYVTYKNELKVKEAGKMNIEGKNYIVNDGDVMHFLFNV